MFSIAGSKTEREKRGAGKRRGERRERTFRTFIYHFRVCPLAKI